MDQPAGVRLEPRIVPFPRSASAAARAMLAEQVTADGAPINAAHPLPDPSDHAAWERLEAAVAASYLERMTRVGGNASVPVETIRVADATIHVATPAASDAPDCAFLDFHGGALVFGGGAACRMGAQAQATRHNVRCYGVDYRMPPAYPYPAALDDALSAYRHVIAQHGAERVIVNGHSAGGNLAAALLLRARDEGLPMPAALVLMSPEVDLTESGDSFETNRLVDVVLPGSIAAANRLYAGEADLAHPYLSPLFGEHRGFPPTFIQAGTRDLFLSNAARMHRALRKAGVEAELHVCEGMPHGGFTGDTPEDRDLADEVVRFVRTHWPVAPA